MTAELHIPGDHESERALSGPRVEVAPDHVSQVRAAAFKVLWVTGRYATASALATILGHRTAARVRTDLDWLASRGRARLGSGGEVTGIGGLSTTPTRHQVVLADRRRHTWCAIDALGILTASGFDGHIESSPPDNRPVVTVAFEAGVPLPTAAVVFVFQDETCASVIDDWCPNTNLFASAMDARAWQEGTQTGGSILDVATAAAGAAHLWRALFA